MTFDGNHITVTGRAVRYYEMGQPGQHTLLLLHGGFGDAKLHWEETGRQLVQNYHIIAPDLPGYGESEPLEKMTIDNLVEWARALLKELGLSKVVVVANSFSGLIARLLAVRYPRQVTALVLVNGGVIPAVNTMARFVSRLPLVGSRMFRHLSKQMTSRSELAQGIEDKALMTDAFIDVVRREQIGLARLLRTLATSPAPDQTVPQVPTLLLWGEEDAIIPRISGEYIHQAIPGSRLELIANARHMPHLEAPDIFVWQLEEFLNNLS